MKGKQKTIVLDRIKDPVAPLRSDLSHEAVQDLTESIKRVGIIEPLVVRKKDGDFEIIAGHRRLVACGIVGLTEAPCIVVDVDDEKAELLKLHENLNRTDINPIDWAFHLVHLKKQYQYSTAKLAKMLGMSEAWVTQHLAIKDYDTPLLEGLKHNTIAFSSARELAQIKDPKKRGVYIKHAISGGITTALAVQWRKEANREIMDDKPATGQAEATPQPSPEPETLPVCPICSIEIKPEEQVTLVVHKTCQPK